MKLSILLIQMGHAVSAQITLDGVVQNFGGVFGVYNLGASVTLEE